VPVQPRRRCFRPSPEKPVGDASAELPDSTPRLLTRTRAARNCHQQKTLLALIEQEISRGATGTAGIAYPGSRDRRYIRRGYRADVTSRSPTGEHTGSSVRARAHIPAGSWRGVQFAVASADRGYVVTVDSVTVSRASTVAGRLGRGGLAGHDAVSDAASSASSCRPGPDVVLADLAEQLAARGDRVWFEHTQGIRRLALDAAARSRSPGPAPGASTRLSGHVGGGLAGHDVGLTGLAGRKVAPSRWAVNLRRRPVRNFTRRGLSDGSAGRKLCAPHAGRLADSTQTASNRHRATHHDYRVICLDADGLPDRTVLGLLLSSPGWSARRKRRLVSGPRSRADHFSHVLNSSADRCGSRSLDAHLGEEPADRIGLARSWPSPW